MLSLDSFRADCAELLSPRDAQAVDTLLGFSPASDHPFVRGWQAFVRSLTTAVSSLRAAALNRDYSCGAEPPDPAHTQLAAAAFRLDSPLERERLLDAHRWAHAEALASFDAFTAEAILAYAIKLMSATRWASFDADAGRARLDSMLSDAASAALNMDNNLASTEDPA